MKDGNETGELKILILQTTSINILHICDYAPAVSKYISDVLQRAYNSIDSSIHELQRLERHLNKRPHMGIVLSKGVLDNLAGVFTVRDSIDLLFKKKYIEEQEYERLLDMTFASYEDLVVALEITRNLCSQHAILRARLKYCTLKSPTDV